MCPETNVSETRAFDSKPLSQVCLKYRKVPVKGSVSAGLNSFIVNIHFYSWQIHPTSVFAFGGNKVFMASALYANVNAVTNNATHESL